MVYVLDQLFFYETFEAEFADAEFMYFMYIGPYTRILLPVDLKILSKKSVLVALGT